MNLNHFRISDECEYYRFVTFKCILYCSTHIKHIVNLTINEHWKPVLGFIHIIYFYYKKNHSMRSFQILIKHLSTYYNIRIAIKILAFQNYLLICHLINCRKCIGRIQTRITQILVKTWYGFVSSKTNFFSLNVGEMHTYYDLYLFCIVCLICLLVVFNQLLSITAMCTYTTNKLTLWRRDHFLRHKTRICVLKRRLQCAVWTVGVYGDDKILVYSI